MYSDAQAVERYRLKLRSKVCYQVGGFCPDVDDLVQETLTRFLTAIRDQKIHKPDSAGAFLNGICNNVILEYRRRLWREPPAPDSAPVLALVPSEAEQFELRQQIAAVLSELSDRDCNLLCSFYLQEKSKDEICRSAGVSEAQLRVALFRAKDRFRKIYLQKMKRAATSSH